MTTATEFMQNIGLIDDTEVAVDAKGYVGQSNPPPCPPGTYGFKVKAIDIKKDRNTGEPILKTVQKNGKDYSYPTIVLEQLELVEPEDRHRLVMLYQDFSTKPFERVPGRAASQAGDLFRGFDTESSVTTLELIEALLAQAKSGQIFYADLDWKAADWGYAIEKVEELGLRKPDDSKAINDLFQNAQQTGWYKFRNDAGKISHLWEGPSGTIVEARAYLKKIYAANKPPKNVGVARGFEPF